MENEKIHSDAKEILDKFGDDLKDIKIQSNFMKEGGELREEKDGESCDVEFKTIMFKNAKRKDDAYLILEKSSWN